MLLLTAIGPMGLIRAAADELDRHDPSPADAVSWFEEEANRFRLEVYVPTEQDADSARAIIGAAAPELHVNVSEIQPADWVAMALDGLPAVQAGRFVVAGAHALTREWGGRKRIWIEASEAFGTGHHGTTWGCLVALEDYLRRNRSPSSREEGVRGWGDPRRSKVRARISDSENAEIHPAPYPLPSRGGGFTALDVGTGSGVLSIAAAKCGAHALAIEIDPRAAQIAAINAKQNHVAHRVRVIAGDGARHIAGKKFDLVFANILMRPLIRLAPRLAPAVAPGGTLILSGLLRTQAPLVKQAYQSRGLVLTRTIKRESWATLVWRKPQRL
ncbi:MAG: 50S ribosomal protein L11 methyltransferase [Alphaproteobacteria bacterium]